MNEQQISAMGATVYWSAGPTDRELLIERLESIDMQRFTPKERTEFSCLENAVKEYCARLDSHRRRNDPRDRIVQKHENPKENGVEVVEVDRGESQNYYTQDFSVRVQNGRIVSTGGYADDYELQQLYDRFRSEITGVSVGQTLVAILAELGGTALRPSGGVYWIPEGAVETWREVVQAVEGSSPAGKNSIYMLRTIMDESAIKAVRDAIVHEITSAAALISEEIYSGELGEEALKNRQNRALKLRQRIGQFEGFLGETLETLKGIVQSMENTAATVMMQRLTGVAATAS